MNTNKLALSALHISLTEFRSETRILKIVSSLIRHKIVCRVHIAALHSSGLSYRDNISTTIELRRFSLRTRGFGNSFLWRCVKYLEFFFRVLFFYKKAEIAIVNVHTLGLLPMGYLFKLIFGSKLVYDTHELETETHGLMGLRKYLFKLVEFLFIRKADHVFVVSENIADWYRDRYKITRPTVVLNSPRKQRAAKENYFREVFSFRNDQTIVLYQGGLTSGRGVELLLESFKQRKNDKLVIVFMGYGMLEDTIKLTAETCKTVFFHNATQYDLSQKLTASADVGIHAIKNTCLNHYFCMPNKLFEYAMAGLPVVVSNMKEMRDFVECHEMGVVIEADTPEAINVALDKLLLMDLNQLARNAKKAVFGVAWDRQEEKILEAYDKLLGES